MPVYLHDRVFVLLVAIRMVGLDALRKEKREQLKREQKDAKRTFDDDGFLYSNLLAAGTEVLLAARAVSSKLPNKECTCSNGVTLFFGPGGRAGLAALLIDGIKLDPMVVPRASGVRCLRRRRRCCHCR